MAGTLRAEATLAGANLIYLLLLAAGGVVVPLSSLPDGAQGVLRLLPITALTDGLRAVLDSDGGGAPLTGVDRADLSGRWARSRRPRGWFRWE